MSERVDDPFDPAIASEEAEFNSLVQALGMAGGFSLYVARCNDQAQRGRLIEELHRRLAPRLVEEVHFEQPIRHLLDELRERKPQAGVICVTGLENSLPPGAEAAPFIANLNAARNSFSQLLSGPLVLWVSERLFKAIVAGAPDFFSIRSGTYFFALRPAQAKDRIDALTRAEAFGSLSTAEKEQRVAAIGELLEDFALLQEVDRDPLDEARLHQRQAELRIDLGHNEQGWRSLAEAATRRLGSIMRFIPGVGAVVQLPLMTRSSATTTQSAVSPEARAANHDSPVSIVILYSPQDGSYCHTLENWLKPLVDSGKIRLWNSGQVQPGMSFDREVRDRVEQAQIILLLISSAFLASEHAYQIEIAHALGRQRRGETLVIPIMIRPTAWELAPFAQFALLPRSGRPISASANQDGAWLEVAKEIERAVAQFSQHR